MLSISKTYETITEESADVGDAEDRGFEFQDEQYGFKDTVRLIKDGGYNVAGLIEGLKDNPTVSTLTIQTTEPEHSRDYFEKGIEKYYYLHITGKGKYLYHLLTATCKHREI